MPNKAPTPYWKRVFHIVARWKGFTFTDYRADKLVAELKALPRRQRDKRLQLIRQDPLVQRAEEHLKKVKAHQRKK